jgi:hypothetical protein
MGRKQKDEKAERKETKAKFEEKLNKLGLGYQELEVPPDQVDREDVEKDLMYTLKSMIPYTNEYYEALAAEEEMDDLLKIKRELVKAKQLAERSQIGQHDDVLAEMLAETNNDFHYFNKLKYRDEHEGKWKYEKKEDPFTYLARGANRLRKAISKQHALLDDLILKKLAAHGKGVSRGKEHLQLDKNKPCSWM